MCFITSTAMTDHEFNVEAMVFAIPIEKKNILPNGPSESEIASNFCVSQQCLKYFSNPSTSKF